MKNLLAFLILSLTFCTGFAQQATHSRTIAGDTIIASSGLDTVTKVFTATAGYSSLSIQVIATKISGTVSLKAYLSSCLDGVNYVVTDSSAAFADQTTNTAKFQKTPAPDTYYKVQVKPATNAATTQSVKVDMYTVFKRYDHS